MNRRIALISEHASPLASVGDHADSGGQNVYVAHIARNLARRGWLVDVFTRRDDLHTPEMVVWEDGVRVIHLLAGPCRPVPKEDLLPFMRDFIEGMIDFMTREGVDYTLVHANFWYSGLAALEIKRRRRIPFVVTFHALGKVRRLHQGGQDRFPVARMDIEREVMRESEAVIAECPQDFEDLVTLYEADPQNIPIVPCGFDPREFYPLDRLKARAELGLPENAFVALQLGRMVPRKGVDTVIRAFAQVPPGGQEAVLLVVGGQCGRDGARDAEIERLRELALSAGIGNAVRFCGAQPRERLKLYYNAADVFITVPWYEPFGITPLESMACGTPVIGSRVGGIQYTVIHGLTGWLVSPKSPEELAERLAWCARHPEAVRVCGEAARRHVQRFTWDHVVDQLTRIYADVERRDLRRQLEAPLPLGAWLGAYSVPVAGRGR